MTSNIEGKEEKYFFGMTSDIGEIHEKYYEFKSKVIPFAVEKIFSDSYFMITLYYTEPFKEDDTKKVGMKKKSN